MYADKFQPGDLVVLKSGGPNMTFREYTKGGVYDEGGLAYVMWFEDGKMQHAFLPSAMIRLAAP